MPVVMSSTRMVLPAAVYSPPSVYAALTDTTLRLEPTLPTMGAAGSIITDPTFGNRILRVTDANTVTAGGRTDSSWYPNDGSAEELKFNSNGTRFCGVGAEGNEQIVFDFNKAALSASIMSFPGPLWYVPIGSVQWHPTNPDVLYGSNNQGVDTYNVLSFAQAQVWNTSSIHATYVPKSLSMADNLRIAGYLGPQDTANLVIAYDFNNSTQWVLDTTAGTLNGSAIPGWVSHTVHNVRMGQDGRYVVITAVGGTGPLLIWDIDGATYTWVTANAGGHKASAYGYLLNNDVPSGPYYTYQVAKRHITNVNLPVSLLVGASASGTDSHYSWCNMISGRFVPMIASSSGEGLLDNAVQIAYDREIYAPSTDGSGIVYRLCHHRSQFHSFYDGPHATISRDGLYAIFASNWGKSLGLDTHAAIRQDIFMVALK
jgi:hypothetical protein